MGYVRDAKFCVSILFRKNCFGRDIRDLAELSRQGVDFVDVAFDDEGDDGGGAVVEGEPLACEHNVRMRGDDLVDQRRSASV